MLERLCLSFGVSFRFLVSSVNVIQLVSNLFFCNRNVYQWMYMSHTVQVRKQGTKTLIEKTRRKVERIRANAIEANKEASAAFAKLMQQEFNRERGRISECQREFKKGLRNQLRKLGEMDDKIVALREETTKLKKGAVKKIGESNKELAVTQERLAGNLRSTFEANVRRRQALHQSDHLFRGISELLTTNELE